MGYDISVEVYGWHEIHSQNYTYNAYEMFHRAFGDEEGIRCLDGMDTTSAKGAIEAALKYFEGHKDELTALEPKNGWGSYTGAQSVLLKIYDACDANPNGRVVIK